MAEDHGETAVEGAGEQGYLVAGDNAEVASGNVDAASGEEEEVDTNDSVVEDHMDACMDKDDPDRMKLRSDELVCALAIRDAVENEAELDNLSDLWYAQLAVSCYPQHDNPVEAALERVHALQAFRQEYEIADTYQDGQRALQFLVERAPEQYLFHAFSQPDGTWLSVTDFTKTTFEGLRDEATLRKLFAGIYYWHHVVSCDLETVRKGPIAAAECEGMGFSMKNDWKVVLKLGSELVACYPCCPRAKYYHTGAFFNVMASMFQKLMPQENRDSFEVGCTAPKRLDEVFMVPTAEVATQRTLDSMKDCLRRRYDNQESFRIPRILAPGTG